MFQFKNFRKRKPKAINVLNFHPTLYIAFPGHISMKSEVDTLEAAIIQITEPFKGKYHSAIMIGKRYLRYTAVCKGSHQTLAQDKTSRIPSVLP